MKLQSQCECINQPPSLYDVLMQRYRSCKTVARVLCLVARAGPVSVEVIQDWLLAAPSQTSPPSCFYDTSILRYPFDLFQWKSMGRVAKVL